MQARFAFCILCLFLGCFPSTVQSSKHLDSNKYANSKERVEVLKAEIKVFSDFQDAEFELFNVNGFSNSQLTIPGASSWDYKFAIRTTPQKIRHWTTGLTKVDSLNQSIQWTKEIVEERKENWQTKSQPEYYIREGHEVMLIVFRQEGILFKRVTAL